MIVYFIECGTEVKIGITADLSQRFAALKGDGRKNAKIIAAVYGDRRLEKALHSKLKRWHVKGEWFQDCTEVRAAIQNTLNNFEHLETVTNERGISPFAEIARTLWPTKTAPHLAASIGCTARAVERYLSGQTDWSGDAVAAIVSEILKRHALRNLKVSALR